MKTPDDVAEILRLKACGWGLKRIARQLGCSHHTVKVYVAADGVKPFKSPERPKRLDGLEVGCASGSFGIAAMRMWCARICWRRKAWRRPGPRSETAVAMARLASASKRGVWELPLALREGECACGAVTLTQARASTVAASIRPAGYAAFLQSMCLSDQSPSCQLKGPEGETYSPLSH